MTITTTFEATQGGLVLTNAILLYQGEAPAPSNPYAPRRTGRCSWP